VAHPATNFEALSVAPSEEAGHLVIELNAAGKPHRQLAQDKHLVPKVIALGPIDVALLGEVRQVSEVTTTVVLFEIGQKSGVLGAGLAREGSGSSAKPLLWTRSSSPALHGNRSLLARHRSRPAARLG
jgi:hypothetical protein